MAVYFLESEVNGLIKIGHAAGVRGIKGRVKSLQATSPVPLRLLGVIPEGDTSVERMLHVQFNHISEYGEWFRPSQDLLDFIKNNTILFDLDAQPDEPFSPYRPLEYDELIQRLGQRIKAARLQSGLTQKDLAKSVGLRQPGLARMESAQIAPTVFNLHKIARQLNQSVGYFFGVPLGLENDEDELITLYRSLSDEKKTTLLDIARVLKRNL